MRFPRNRRALGALAGVLLLSAILAVSFGPIVRSRVAGEAARRHLEVAVGGVRPGWFSVRLTDVRVGLEGAPGISVRFDEVRARLSIGLALQGVDAHGGSLRLTGSADQLRDQLRTWRDRSGGSPSTSGRASAPLSFDALSLRWVVSEGEPPSVDLAGLEALRQDGAVTASAATGKVRLAQAEVELRGASLAFDASGALVRAHAAVVSVGWRERHALEPEIVAPAVSDPAPPTLAIPVVLPRTQAHSRASSRPVAGITGPDPTAPILRLPDLHELRHLVALVVGRVAERVPVGARADVDAMTWQIVSQEPGGRPQFTVGPGSLSVDRTASRLDLTFSSDRRDAGPALSVRVALPTDAGDVSATLEGGPVALSVLGVQEGEAGLVDVAHATITGTARVALAGDGSALSFDAQLGTRGLSIHQPRLALDVVRGVDIDVRARGAATDAGEVRLDDFGATLGGLHLAGSGVLDQEPDHVAASFRFDLPSAPCQSLLDSVPTALLPALQGTKLSGTFGARGRFAFDTRALDDLELEYDVQDGCRETEVPAALARERFKQPFAHRIYLPDGSTGEQSTGPGTPNWTPLASISPFMQVAVMTTEDGAFPHHRGFNRSAIRASLITNLKERRFVRGASTITMQLAKNLFLSRDKTLARKLEEVVLTDYLEQTFSKDEILELYLNVIEFGPAVYGITSAAEYYFGRSPNDLDLAECLFLSSLLPSPLRYGQMRDLAQLPDGWLRNLHNLMTIANKRGLVSDAELTEGLGETIAFWHGGQRPPARPPVGARSSFEGTDDPDAVPAPIDPSPDAP